MTHVWIGRARRPASLVVFALILFGCRSGDGTAPNSEPSSIAIDPTGVELRIGQSLGLDATYLDDTGRPVAAPAGWKPLWSTSDTSVVAVEPDGTIRGVRVGTATVTVWTGSIRDQTSVTVLGAVPNVDSPSRVSAMVDSVGGSITATAQDGTTYTLTVPAAALDAPVEISVAPLSGVDNLPLSGGLTAGVEFQPDGLQFLRPAELTMVTSAPVDPAGLVGFVVSGNEFHLVPLQVRGDTLHIMVGHFSGAGVGGGDTDEVQALANVPTSSAEQAAMQDLGAYTANSAAAGTEPDPVQVALILAAWFESSVRPDLEAAASDPTLLEVALAEFARWEEMLATYADGNLQNEVAVGRSLAATALRKQIDRLNAQCSAQNDWSPIWEILRWTSVAETWGLATDDNGLDAGDVIANLCLQVELLEAKLPETIEAFGSVGLEVQAGISVGGRSAVFDPPLDIVTNDNNTAVVSPQEGKTDGNGRFVADVLLADGVNDAKVDVDARFPQLPVIHATKRVVATGAVSLTLTGKPSGTDAPPSRQVTIDPGGEAEMDLTLLRGRAGYGGAIVTLQLDGLGTLSKTSTGVASDDGKAFFWYTAPKDGGGVATITAILVDRGKVLRDQVIVRYGSFQPTDVELDFGTGVPAPTVEGPVLNAGQQYVVTVSGTYSFWTSEWRYGVCRGSPASSPDGPTGVDAENIFAIPVGSVLCGDSYPSVPTHTSKFRMSFDGGGSFEHVEPVGGKQYNSSHTYQYRITGQGQPVEFMINETGNRGDDYGVLKIHIELPGA